MDIASLIRDARLRKGLSQSEVARRMNIKAQSVQKWESGGARPKLSRFTELAQILDINPFAVLEEEMHGRVEESTGTYETVKQEEVDLLTSVYKELTPEGKEALINIARQLARK